MNWKSIGEKVVSMGLPMLGSVLGGPAGAEVGGMVASALGCDADPKSVDKAIRQDPEAFLKLRQAEMENDYRIRELYLADRQNARAREVGIVQATGEKETNLYVLAWVTVIAFFATVITVIVVDLPTSEASKIVMSMLFGALVSGFKDVLGYFFGSSKSSADKTRMLKS